MRRTAILRFLVLLCFAFAENAPGQLPQVGQDTIFLRQGDRLVGKLTGTDGQSIRLRRLLPPLRGASPDAAPIFASVTVLRSHVDRVQFSSEAQRATLAWHSKILRRKNRPRLRRSAALQPRSCQCARGSRSLQNHRNGDMEPSRGNARQAGSIACNGCRRALCRRRSSRRRR